MFTAATDAFCRSIFLKNFHFSEVSSSEFHLSQYNNLTDYLGMFHYFFYCEIPESK